MKKLLCVIIALMMTTIFIVPISAWSDEKESQIGRYLTTPNKPRPSQINLLSQTIQIRFPQNVRTVGEAMTYMLRFSGYSLVDEKNMQVALKTTLEKSLPIVDRELGPISLKDGLTTLIGTAFNLSHDPVNRTVNFELKSQYAKSFSNKSKNTPERVKT